MSNTTLLFLVFLGCLFTGVPVAIALAVSSLVYLWMADINIAIMANQFFSGMNSFVLVCIPGFLLAGALMNNGGITERIVRFGQAWLGHIRGGMAQANITCSMIFAGVSGTAVSEAASIGSVMIPAMRRSGYSASFSAGLTASASTVGPIIPPSVPMIIVGSMSGLSVGKMFIAGAIPGLLMGMGMMITAYSIARIRQYPQGIKATWRERLLALKEAIWAIITPGLIIAGMVSGLFTPTEAAIAAVLYSIFVGTVIYGELTLPSFLTCLKSSASGTANIVMLVGFANVFGWILTSEGIPKVIADTMLSISTDRVVVILLINLFLLFVGMFMETIAAILILYTPLAAVALAVGMDPINFSVMMVMNLVIGLTTPPVGVCLFVTQQISKISLWEVTKGAFPFLISNIIVLFLVAYIPPLSLWLPNLLY
jgi:C4-dicarboxylate transporter DctM subunit